MSAAMPFVYTGPREEGVPRDVVCVLVDPSVTSIPARAFYERMRLAEVELSEGLVEIGVDSFGWCHHSISKIIIPNSLRRIRELAFNNSLRTPIRLHDGIESIGRGAFAQCIFTNFRVPPLITVIPDHMLSNCRATFSLELPEDVTEIGEYALNYCYCLRNVAFPPDTVFGYNIFIMTGVNDMMVMDLYQLFGSIGSIAEIICMLQHRFDGLCIHKLVYYQSYNQGVLQILIAAINMRSSQPTGNQQDCLGMTPLHILACSSVHNIEIYRVIVDNYPTNLITEDRWGALPLLYAFWGAAPTEIIQFLVDSYQSLYPDQVFNWTMMVETMGRCDTPKESIENLLWVKQMHFPEQTIDWDYLLDQFALSSRRVSFDGLPFQERMQFLVMCGLSDSVEALAFKVWRDHITTMIHTADYKWSMDNYPILYEIREKLAHFEAEYPKLKEIATILELALWKLRMNASHLQKKTKTDESSMRRLCRSTCGADVIIGHVLPYIISTDDEEYDLYQIHYTKFTRTTERSNEE
jgi:hypothetical protein